MTTKGQYEAGFEEWWIAQLQSHPDFQSWRPAVKQQAFEAWQAASLRMEKIKDAGIGAELSRMKAKIATQITQYEAAAKARMQVHRDDYERGSLLIAGLKRIEKMGGRAGQAASECLDETLVSLRKIRQRERKNA